MKSKVSISIVLVLLLLISTILPTIGSLHSAFAQTACDNEIMHSSGNALPVILIHGYKEPADVWSLWEHRLALDNIPFCTVTFDFSDDECGSAMDHAREIGPIIDWVKRMTGEDRVNIAAHSKGGLDARVFLGYTSTSDVANIIMIGTPNGGGPLADLTISTNIFNPYLYYPSSYFCTPALFDLETNADATEVGQNPNTNYYTIYGNWEPSLPCRGMEAASEWYDYLASDGHVPNDGLVPSWSSEALENHVNLGSTAHCHTDLLNDIEYEMSKPVLLSR